MIHLKTNILNYIDSFLILNASCIDSNYDFRKICLWEYIYTLNKAFKKHVIMCCWSKINNILKIFGINVNTKYYKESIKINRILMLYNFDKNCLKYRIPYKIVNDNYKPGNIIWNCYPSTGYSKDDYLIHLLSKFNTCISHNKKVIVKVDKCRWDKYNRILYKEFTIYLPIPNIHDNIFCNYKLIYNYIQLYQTTNLWICLTHNHLKIKKIYNAVVKNLKYILDNCYRSYSDTYDTYKGIVDEYDIYDCRNIKLQIYNYNSILKLI